MTKVRVKLNSKGVRALLQSNELRTVCAQRAQNAMAHLGPGYETNTYVGKTRANAGIRAKTRQARSDALKNGSIWRAVFGK